MNNKRETITNKSIIKNKFIIYNIYRSAVTNGSAWSDVYGPLPHRSRPRKGIPSSLAESPSHHLGHVFFNNVFQKIH